LTTTSAPISTIIAGEHLQQIEHLVDPDPQRGAPPTRKYPKFREIERAQVGYSRAGAHQPPGRTPAARRSWRQELGGEDIEADPDIPRKPAVWVG
jgi:hypothetical protein